MTSKKERGNNMANLITAIQTTSFGAAVFYMTSGAFFFWIFSIIKNIDKIAGGLK